MTRQVETASLSHSPDTLTSFDYAAPAELFIARNTFGRGRLSYRRFTSAAMAIRFAIEELPARLRGGAVMEVLEARFDHRAIRQLYEGLDYTLTRHQLTNKPRPTPDPVRGLQCQRMGATRSTPAEPSGSSH